MHIYYSFIRSKSKDNNVMMTYKWRRVVVCAFRTIGVDDSAGQIYSDDYDYNNNPDHHNYCDDIGRRMYHIMLVANDLDYFCRRVTKSKEKHISTAQLRFYGCTYVIRRSGPKVRLRTRPIKIKTTDDSDDDYIYYLS